MKFNIVYFNPNQKNPIEHPLIFSCHKKEDVPKYLELYSKKNICYLAVTQKYLKNIRTNHPIILLLHNNKEVLEDKTLKLLDTNNFITLIPGKEKANPKALLIRRVNEYLFIKKQKSILQRQETLRNKNDKTDLLQLLRRDISALPYSTIEQKADLISIIADELIMNAIFNANPRFHNSPRNTHFKLSTQEIVQVEWKLIENSHLYFSITDPFASFTRSKVLAFLQNFAPNNEFFQREISGGIGLKFVCSQVSEIIIHLKKEHFTKVSCIYSFSSRKLHPLEAFQFKEEI